MSRDKAPPDAEEALRQGALLRCPFVPEFDSQSRRVLQGH